MPTDNYASQSTSSNTTRSAPRGWLIWLSATGVAGVLLIGATVLAVVTIEAWRGFWPGPVEVFTTASGQQYRLEEGIRLLERDSRMIRDYPPNLTVIEHIPQALHFGYVEAVKGSHAVTESDADNTVKLNTAMRDVAESKRILQGLNRDLRALNDKIDALQTERKQLAQNTREEATAIEQQLDKLINLRREIAVREKMRWLGLQEQTLEFRQLDGQRITLPLLEVRHVYQPNQMTTGQRFGLYFTRLRAFLLGSSDVLMPQPGLVLIVLSTLAMILLMSILILPWAVGSAIYLNEYARHQRMISGLHWVIQNLDGVPAVVYGLFGLAFFVSHDGLVGAVSGLGVGLLWAALTVGLLVLPSIIMATHKSLEAVPRSSREASLALGATPWQTLVSVVLPQALPAIHIGFLKAFIKAAGTVVPLIILGLATAVASNPFRSDFPFLQLDEPFYHLGLYIFNAGFWSNAYTLGQSRAYLLAFTFLFLIFLVAAVIITLQQRACRQSHKGMANIRL